MILLIKWKLEITTMKNLIIIGNGFDLALFQHSN